MLGLVRPFQRDSQIVGLLLGQFGEFHADFFQMQSRHFFIQFFRQAIDPHFVAVFVLPQVELREDLIGEAVAHHETRMAFRATEIHEPALGEQVNAFVAGQIVAVHLRLDVHARHAFRVLQPVHLNLVVEVADVAHDGLVLHLEDVVERDDVAIARGRHVDVADAQRVFERGDLMISMMLIFGKMFSAPATSAMRTALVVR